jgi:putative membrane protein
MVSVRAHLPRTRAAWLIGGVSLLVVMTVAALLTVPRVAPSGGRLDVSGLPRLNALLNAVSAILLSIAYLFIRRRRIRLHRLCMLSAFGLSALFLASYVVYHAYAGSTRFAGPDWIRPIYYVTLISHIVLAALIVPLALTTLYRALRGTFVRHRRIARWTLPIWLYVSVSGVAIYLILYHLPES